MDGGHLRTNRQAVSDTTTEMRAGFDLGHSTRFIHTTVRNHTTPVGTVND